MSFTRNVSIGALLAGCISVAQADVVKIGTEPGWSGFLSGTINGSFLASNTIAGTRAERITPRKISSINQSPSTSESFGFAPNYEVRYTFRDTRTQVVFGNLLQDAIRFDFTALLGVRQDLAGKGIFTGGLLFATFPNRVYKDPYIDNNRRRADTDRLSRGVRLAWERIWASKFSLLFDGRDIELNSENSGDQLIIDDMGLPPEERRLNPAEQDDLDRDGQDYRLELTYDLTLKPQQWFLTPAIQYVRRDRDGDAMSTHEGDLLLSLAYQSRSHNLIGTARLGYVDADETNPIYGKKSDAVQYGLGLIYLNRTLIPVKKLSLLATASYGRIDNDNRFYDLKSGGVAVGVLWRFSTIKQRKQDRRGEWDY